MFVSCFYLLIILLSHYELILKGDYMKKILSYDLPTRLFHWIFAALFIIIYLIAETIDDDSVTYSYHMLLGLVMALVVILRIVWGFVGSKYAKFSSFELHPIKMIEYITDIISGKTKLFAGHNPASSWAAILMMIFALGLAFTGIQMSQGNSKEFYEDIHEFLANAFLFTVIAHVLGIIFHSIRHKDLIALSMINGEKSASSDQEPIKSQHPIVAAIFVILVLAFGFKVFSSFDPATRKLNLMGYTLTLGESEDENESSEYSDKGEKNDDGEDDEDDND